MLRKNAWIVLAVTVLLMLCGFFYYFYAQRPTLNWTVNFNHRSSTPYGNELLYKLLQNRFPNRNFYTVDEPLIRNTRLKRAANGGSVYFYSGFGFSPDRTTTGVLIDFIKKGNEAFIAADGISTFFIDSLLQPENATSDNIYSNCLPLLLCRQFEPVLIHPDFSKLKKFTIEHRVMKTTFPMEVAYFSDAFFENRGLNKPGVRYFRMGDFQLGKNQRFTNYIAFRVGAGRVHLYSTPLVFTNYHLREQKVYDYTDKILSHLPESDVFWHVNQFVNADVDPYNTVSSESPFNVLLRYDSLRYAWYTFLCSVLVFGLYTLRRRQRAIPVLPGVSNTSLEFAETISKLYLLDGNHKNIAMQKFKYFFSYVKSRYGVDLKSPQEDDLQRLSEQSKMHRDELNQILELYKVLTALPDASEEELNKVVTGINRFYAKVGYIKKSEVHNPKG